MKTKKGFTLVELLVVIAIIAILVSILMPALSRMRDSARMTVCKTNQKALGFGMRQYADDYEEKVPCWGWEYDECGRFDTVVTGTSWTEPTIKQMTKGFEGGYIWEYANNAKMYVCPSLNADKMNPRNNPANAGCPVWGWPNPTNPSRNGPVWSYTANFQPGVSLKDPQWRVNPDLVVPSPYDVFMLYEEDYTLLSSYDNGGALFPAEDYLGRYHMVSNEVLKAGQMVTLGSGNLVFFDGHVEDMNSEIFMDRVTTTNGMKQLCGGYMGFTWP